MTNNQVPVNNRYGTRDNLPGLVSDRSAQVRSWPKPHTFLTQITYGLALRVTFKVVESPIAGGVIAAKSFLFAN